MRNSVLIGLPLAAVLSLPCVSVLPEKDSVSDTKIVCVMDIPEGAESRVHEMMLTRFASIYGLESEIIYEADEAALDTASLIVSRAALDSIPSFAEIAFEDSSRWILLQEDHALLRELGTWTGSLMESGHFRRLKRNYIKGKTVSLTEISPYDDIIKEVAAHYGWDWRLLAAVIYHESRFTNEASSVKGATGLMQIISARYSAETLLDPEENLRIGTRYLTRLRNIFSPYAADSTEVIKFALGAYNAGEGKILRCIQTVESEGLDSGRWDNISPLTKRQTRVYVSGIMETYGDYLMMYAQ